MEECPKAYQELKDLLLKELVVAYPDFSVPFRLYTNASNIGLVVILTQKQEAESRMLNKSEQNYSATKKECLAVVWGIKNFCNYTDHYSLQWLRSMKNEPALLQRWAAQLEDYDFEILHRPGKIQGHVDVVSRLPVDKVQFLGPGKTTLQTAEDTAQVLERIHQDGHLGIMKTLKIFRKRFKVI